jgi:hypothetical protein
MPHSWTQAGNINSRGTMKQPPAKENKHHDAEPIPPKARADRAATMALR